METIRTKRELREALASARAADKTVGLVPTMGALHAGHLTLIQAARECADLVLVSIFVNPTQFAAGEDFESYPRDEVLDIGLAATAGADLVFAPAADEIYPEGFATSVTVSERLTGVMCGAKGRRGPSHFDGVTTVVAKLLSLVSPDFAYFGEKDAQQLAVIRRLTADLDLPVEIVGVATVRDTDGLALSSRNAYLSKDERLVAPELHRALRGVADAVVAGQPFEPVAEAATYSLEEAGFGVEYLELRDSDSLAAGRDPRRRAIVAAAARLGSTRLIDNVVIEPTVAGEGTEDGDSFSPSPGFASTGTKPEGAADE